MFQQFAKDRGITELLQNKKSGCKTFVMDLGGKLTCKLDDFNVVNGKQPKLISVDHIYPTTAVDKTSLQTVVLYGQPGVAGFNEIHTKLKDLAEKGQILYVLRPYLLQRENKKTRLSGVYTT